MEKIRELLRKPSVCLALGAFVGLIIGWFGIGWGVWPVQWKDASARELRADLQADYLRLAVESYSQTPDDSLAKKRWAEFGETGLDTFKTLQSDAKIDQAKLDVFRQVVGIGRLENLNQPAKTGQETQTTDKVQDKTAVSTESALNNPLSATQPANTDEGSGPGINLVYLLIILVVLTIVIGGMLFFFIFIRPRLPGDNNSQSAEKDVMMPPDGDYSYDSDEQGEAIAQFMTAYTLGDDLYDDSFSIDSPSGEFLGECGVGVSDTIGVGDPKKVSAFEVWLFDKNDIQTVTKVLMSDHAYNDPDTCQKLAAKGEPVLVTPGKSIILETATLQMEARVVDISYGQGALPYGSFFDRLTLELAIWPKNLG